MTRPRSSERKGAAHVHRWPLDEWRPLLDLSRTDAPVFIDGDRVTPGTSSCVCTLECEMPCWMRLGMTTSPCCKGCAPLPDFDDDTAAPADDPANAA